MGLHASGHHLAILFDHPERPTPLPETVALTLEAQGLRYPVTRKGDQVDVYHGTAVADPFRWLEDDTSDETKAWVNAQNLVTFGYLRQIPYRDRLRDRMTDLVNYPRISAPEVKERQSAWGWQLG